MPPTSTDDDTQQRLRDLIRDVPDYPKPGIVFKDITPLLGDPAGFVVATDAMAAPFRDSGITHVVAIESRGFILGGPVAQRLGAGFVPVRKMGKLPSRTRRETYDLEYGTDTLEIHVDACGSIVPGATESAPRVLVVDDVLATGGTADATRRLVEALGASVVGFSFLISLSFLPGVARLRGQAVSSVLTY